MKTININQSIRILSVASRYGIVLATAILAGKICWWVANPLGYATLNNVSTRQNLKTPGSLASGIVNRAPFGVVTVVKAPPPSILEQVKVVGVYAAGPNNSVAFLQINNKHSIAVIGDDVEGAVLKEITSNGIVLYSESHNVTINISGGSNNTDSNGMPAQTSSHDFNQHNNSYTPNNQNSVNNENNSNNAADNGGRDDDSIAEKRRKMIEAFQKQNSNNDNPTNH